MPLTLDIINPEDIDNPYRIDLWMRKPSAIQYDEALGKARGKQGRRRALYRDPNSDEYLAVTEQINGLDKEDLVKELLAFELNDLRTQAYNEALYGDNEEDEPRWGKDGADYLDIIAGLRERYEEIDEYNSKLPEEDRATMSLTPEEDEEIARLNKIVDEFGKQRDERLEKLTAKKEAELNAKPSDQLRKELIKKIIDLEVNLIHYQEFKTLMVYYAARYPDDHHKQYFASPDEIWDLPDHIRGELFNAYDQLEMGAVNLKNSPSPQPS